MNKKPQMILNSALAEKWDKLVELFREMGGTIVAFSGGVDSGLLAAAAFEANGSRMLAVTIHSEVETSESVEVAQHIAREVGFPHLVIEHDDLPNPQFKSNPVDRCYHCKLDRFKRAKDLAMQKGYQWVVEGSNASDLGDYRPGMRAVQELGVRSPLVEVGLTKDEIRHISKALGLSNWDRPSAPCLATRFPYGTEVTVEGIKKVAEGEIFLRSLGYSQLRVRYHGNLVRIEVPTDQIGQLASERKAVVDFFKALGFIFVTLDMAGFRSGSMNQEIKQ